MALYNLYIYLYINLYSAPSRQLLRGAPSPGSAKQESLEEFIKRTGKVMRPMLSQDSLSQSYFNGVFQICIPCRIFYAEFM